MRQRLGIEYFDEHVEINDLGFQARNNYRQIRSAHTRTTSDLSWARNNQFDVRGYLQQNGDGYFSRGGISSLIDNIQKSDYGYRSPRPCIPALR